MLRDVTMDKLPKIEASDLMLAILASVLLVSIGVAIRMAYELGRLETMSSGLTRGSDMQNASQVASRIVPDAKQSGSE